MTTSKPFAEQLEEIRSQIAALDDSTSAEEIEKTARRLEGLNYTPSIITPNDRFLRLDRKGLLEEVDRIASMPEEEACALAPGDKSKCEDLRLQFMRVLLFYYRQLLRLRNGDPETWDEVDELYVHD